MKIFRLSFIVLFFGFGINAQSQTFKSLISEIEITRTQLVPDNRVAILIVSLKDTLKTTVILKGKTNLPEAKEQILKLLTERRIQFVDSINVLPEVSLGDKTWGLATLSASSMRSRPDHAAEMVSQALMGTPLKVLEYDGGWYRVQTPDQYIGWMEGSGLQRFTESEMNNWKKSNRYVYNRISGNAFESPDERSAEVTDLVLGDLFVVEAETDGFLKIMTPDSRSGYVRKNDCLSWSEWTGHNPDVSAMISVTRKLLGSPYLWGGTCSKAVDCSGLTKTAYFSQGIILARDASQQARYGEHPDFADFHNLQSGDLLFFGRSAQHITHVGLYIGDGKYIHSSGLVRINSVDPNDPKYNISLRKNLVASSRVLNSLDTEGITLVKDHPWYSVINQQ
ncbi:MAG: C40 family peptidase [Prolixibacteraceae bacterium]|jgi:hypothetical protein